MSIDLKEVGVFVAIVTPLVLAGIMHGRVMQQLHSIRNEMMRFVSEQDKESEKLNQHEVRITLLEKQRDREQ